MQKLKKEELDELPVAYQNMAGHFNNDEKYSVPPPVPTEEKESSNKGRGKKEFFLTKEYNIEQKKIICLLEDNGCVSVQGPPGTGKSHTIANLIGHLLAKGQSVLVSSYRSKALEVIRGQVVENIRPLCVSILDNQKKNKEQLQGAVNYLEELTSNYDSSQLSRELIKLKKERDNLIKQVDKLESEYKKCVSNEYIPISFMGKPILPIDASKFIK